MATIAALVFLVGLIFLTIGAELVLRSASKMAAFLGVRPIVIGLTIVSIGTSLPELAVGVTASVESKGILSVANIAGTNPFNIFFILGLSAIIKPLPITMLSVRLDVPAMIITSILFLLFSLNLSLSVFEGTILLLTYVIYVFLLIKLSKRESYHIRKEFSKEYSIKKTARQSSKFKGLLIYPTILLAGMGLTILGAHYLVEGAKDIIKIFGVSDEIIGLTIVAVGTSSPELVTTIIATIKNERDVAIGNLIGSSISNILVIQGIVCIASPQEIHITKELVLFDLPFGILLAFLCYPVFKSGMIVSRSEGVLFVSLYLVYLLSILVFRI